MACGLLLCIVHLHTTTEPSSFINPSMAVEQTSYITFLSANSSHTLSLHTFTHSLSLHTFTHALSLHTFTHALSLHTTHALSLHTFTHALSLHTFTHALSHCTPSHMHSLSLHTFTHSSQEQQSTKGVDPQPEYYIDQVAQMTEVSSFTSSCFYPQTNFICSPHPIFESITHTLILVSAC